MVVMQALQMGLCNCIGYRLRDDKESLQMDTEILKWSNCMLVDYGLLYDLEDIIHVLYALTY